MESSQKEEDSPSSKGSTEVKKCCSDCKTTKTPLWRSGPSGPKSLCNACGIRFRKKRPSATTTTAAVATVKNDLKKGKIGKTRNLKMRDDGWRMNLVPLELMEGKKRVRNPRQWGEVERAALLLMALSCGAVFA